MKNLVWKASAVVAVGAFLLLSTASAYAAPGNSQGAAASCKNGGYLTSTDPVYKNQGACVSATVKAAH